jgi:hypothetical protein
MCGVLACVSVYLQHGGDVTAQQSHTPRFVPSLHTQKENKWIFSTQTYNVEKKFHLQKVHFVPCNLTRVCQAVAVDCGNVDSVV